LSQAAATVLDPLAFKAVSYGLILLIALVVLVLSLVSFRKEFISDKPVHGLFPLVLIIAGLCVLISLATAYVQFQRPVSILLRWERAALTSKE
jgi:membrane protease YdiL (CAAX protease family)